MVDNSLKAKMENMFFVKGWRLTINELQEYTGEKEENIVEVLKEMEDKKLIEFIDCHYEKRRNTNQKKVIDIYHSKYEGIIKYLTNHDEVYISQMIKLFPEKDVYDVMIALDTRDVLRISMRKYKIYDYTRVKFFVHDNPGIGLKAIISHFGFTMEEARRAVGIAIANKSIILRNGAFFTV